MAYVPKQLPDDQENIFGRTEPTTPYPTPQGGGSSGSGTAAPGVGTSTQFGSNAAKLTDYLKANEPQIQQFGQEVAGKLTDSYNQTKGAIDQGFGGFNQSVSGGYTPNDPTLVNQAAQDPYGFSRDQGNVQKFQSLYNNQYTGPQNAEGSQMYADVNNRVNQAVQNASLVGSEGGMSTYLDQFGGANKTQGMKTLDTALLQRTPEARQAIKTAATPFQGLTDYLNSQVTSSNEAIKKAQDEAAQSREATRNQFTGQGGLTQNFQTDLTNRTNAAMEDFSKNQNLINNITGDIGGGDLSSISAEEWQAMGISPEVGAQLTTLSKAYQGVPVTNTGFSGAARNEYVNLGNFFKPGETIGNMPGISNVASEADYKKDLGLETLLGDAYNQSLNPDQISMAGQLPSHVNPQLDYQKLVAQYADPLMSSTGFISTPRYISQPYNPGYWSGYSDQAKFQILDNVLANKDYFRFGGDNIEALINALTPFRSQFTGAGSDVAINPYSHFWKPK